MANRQYYEYLKKMLPLLQKEEGTVVNRQLAKEAAERGAQLDNPTLAEQLKSIKLPEEQRGFVLGEASDIARPPVLHDPVNLPVPSQGKLPTVIETPQTLELDPSSFTDLSKLDEKLANVNMAGPQSWQAKLDKLREISNTNKGKIAAGGAGLGLMALSGNGEQQAMKDNASTEVANAIKSGEIDQPETEEEKAIKAQIKQLSIAPVAAKESTVDQPTVIDFGDTPSVASLERLQQLQQQANEDSRWARMAQAFSQARAGMSGQAEDRFSKGYDEDIKAIQSIPEQYKQQVAFEKEDPNSAQSQGYRNLAKSMGFEIKGNASAADIERQIPQLANIYNQKEAAKSRKELAEENRKSRLQEMQLRLAGTQDTKKEQQKNKFIQYGQTALAKEFKEYQKLENAYDALEQAVEDKVGPADVAILYNFIKSLDPASVVREGEIALGQRGMSLAGRMYASTLGQFSGEMLSPQFRRDVLKIADRLKNQGHTSYDQVANVLRDTGRQRYGMSEEELGLIDPMLNRQQKAAKQMDKVGLPVSDQTKQLINSRSESENRKRLQELEAKYGKAKQ